MIKHFKSLSKVKNLNNALGANFGLKKVLGVIIWLVNVEKDFVTDAVLKYILITVQVIVQKD